MNPIDPWRASLTLKHCSGAERGRKGGMNGFPAFDRYIGIDYSGAKTPTSSLGGHQ
jgi:hypothetical protein